MHESDALDALKRCELTVLGGFDVMKDVFYRVGADSRSSPRLYKYILHINAGLLIILTADRGLVSCTERCPSHG